MTAVVISSLPYLPLQHHIFSFAGSRSNALRLCFNMQREALFPYFQYNPLQIFYSGKTPAALYARLKWLHQEETSTWRKDFREAVNALFSGQCANGSWNLFFIGFKRLSCPEAWIKHTIATFRWKMVQVAGRIVRHSKSIILKLAVDIEKLELFKGIRGKIFELSLVLDG